MYDTETRTRFIEFRGQGRSIKRIASRLKIVPRTLVESNRQDNIQIRTLRVLELEALQEVPPALRARTAVGPKQNCSISASFLPHLNHVFAFHIIT